MLWRQTSLKQPTLSLSRLQLGIMCRSSVPLVWDCFLVYVAMGNTIKLLIFFTRFCPCFFNVQIHCIRILSELISSKFVYIYLLKLVIITRNNVYNTCKMFLLRFTKHTNRSAYLLYHHVGSIAYPPYTIKEKKKK